MKSLYSLLLSLSLLSAYGQNAAYFNVEAIDDSVTVIGQHNRQLQLSFPGLNKPLLYVTRNMVTNAMYYGNHISNITAVAYKQLYNCYAINANDLSDTIGAAIITPSKKSIYFISQTGNTGVSCNGKVSIKIDTVGHGTGSLLFASDIYGGSSSPLMLSQGPNTLSNRCPGKHAVAAIPGSNASEATTFYVGDFDLIHPSSNFNVTVNPYGLATGTMCIGQANTSVSGASGPFQYSYDGAAYTSSNTAVNLCEGYHSVMVKNATDTAGSYFIISNSNNVINNANTGGPVVDTIIYNFANCSFNYNQTVDSAFLTTATTIDSNTVFLAWEIWQGGSMTAISDTISCLYQQGNNMISLVVFCGSARQMIAGNFNSKRVNDYAKLSYNFPTGIQQKPELSGISVYPNPFTDVVHINAKGEAMNVELLDLLGRDLSMSLHGQRSKNGMEFDTSELPQGCYFLRVSVDGQSKAFKIIKH
jgi:hypothetical protein